MKKLVALFLALVMILSLAACGGPQTDPTTAPTNPNPTDPTPAPTQPVDIATYSQSPYI